MLLVLRFFMAFESGEQPAKKRFDLAPEQLDCHQRAHQGAKYSLKNYAACSCIQVSRNILVNGYEENSWRNGSRYQARRTFHVRTPYFIRNLLRI